MLNDSEIDANRCVLGASSKQQDSSCEMTVNAPQLSVVVFSQFIDGRNGRRSPKIGDQNHLGSEFSLSGHQQILWECVDGITKNRQMAKQI